VAQKRTGELPRSHGAAGGGWSNPAALVDEVWRGGVREQHKGGRNPSEGKNVVGISLGRCSMVVQPCRRGMSVLGQMRCRPHWLGGRRGTGDKREACGGGVVVVPRSDVALVGEVLTAEKKVGADFVFGIPHGGRLFGSTTRLAEGVGVGEGFEAGTCQW
jgi:hypothetical protein